MKRVCLAVASGVFLSAGAVVRAQQRVYIACDDHTDYIWTADADAYRASFLRMLDYYLDLADQTAGNAPDFRSRFACDGSLWLWEYERSRTPAQWSRLVGRLRDGTISAPMTPLVILWGGAPAEAVLRGMAYAGRLERREGLRFDLAVSMENQALPWGLASLWAGSGARYSWKGICGCVTRVPNPGDREHDAYWYTGPDGQRVLMKWNSLVTGDNQSIGGYAEARNIPAAVNLVTTSPAFQALWPYPVISIFGRGWDDLETLTDDFVVQAPALSNPSRRVIVSNERDFFLDFEASHGAGLPTVDYSYGNEWELYCASMAEVSSSVKRAVEALRPAEAMASIVSLFEPAFMAGRETARDLAFMDLGLYWEHDWTGDGPVPRQTRANWQRQIAGEISSYVSALGTDATAALGRLIAPGNQGPGALGRYLVFNPLSWARTDAADLPWPGALPVRVIDVSTGAEAPSQVVTLPSNTPGGAVTRAIRFLAADVPSVGYRVYEVRSGAGQAFPPAASVAGGVIESAATRVTMNAAGAIGGLVDKARGDRQFAAVVNGRSINDFGSGSGGALGVENAGPVSVTLKAVVPGPLPRTARVTLFAGSDRVEIRNEILGNFADVRTWGFGFNLQGTTTRHEEVGAIATAALRSAGGSYAARQMRYDWLTMNHFVDVTAGAGANAGFGVTVSNADCFFFAPGAGSVAALDASSPSFRVLAGGQVDGAGLGIQNQDGDSFFLQRFALRTHAAYDQASAMRFALEHQNPLVVGRVTGETPRLPAARFSALAVSDPSVILWALKPAEEGINAPASLGGGGLVARLWNVGETPATPAVVTAPFRIGAARIATHIETNTGAQASPSGLISPAFARQQMRTFRLTLSCLADADGDGVVGFSDLNIVLSQFGASAAPGSILTGDADGDGAADFTDLNLVLSRFGSSCP